MRVASYRQIGLPTGPSADFSRSLQASPIIWGRLLDVETDGTGAAQLVRHGLGRAFQGAIVVGVGNTGLLVAVGSPQNVIDAGEDPALFLRIDPDASAVTTVRLWVF